MENHLKLYQSNASPNSRRVRIYLAERGIDAELIQVDLSGKEQFTAAYAAINSRRVVPTLVLADGTAIGEVPAILRHLDEAFPERPLNGATATEKALVVMWERRVELDGFAAVMETVRNAAKRPCRPGDSGAAWLRADSGTRRARPVEGPEFPC
jgi:glutathione S-transferase